MKTTIPITLLTLAFAILGACTMEPTGPNVQTAGPKPNNVGSLVQIYLNESLKDPYSVRGLTYSLPREGGRWTGLVNQGLVPSWYSCVKYNAKNSFGGYVGQKEHVFFIRDDRVTGRIWQTGESGFDKHTCW